MTEKDLSKLVAVEIPLGHILLAWETLSDKFSDLRSNDALSEEERRAIWGLADVLENALIDNGLSCKPQSEWDALIESSKKFIKNIPVDFLD